MVTTTCCIGSKLSAPASRLVLAVITFCTVVWRGLITTEQARLQRIQVNGFAEQLAATRDQLGLTREQLEATRESNLADLLQRGAELLSETKKGAHVAAGIAILRSIVVAGPSGKFQVEAMDLLADYLQASHRKDHSDPLCQTAIGGLRDGFTAGIRSRRNLQFESEGRTSWSAIVGVSSVKYIGGTIDRGQFDILIKAGDALAATRAFHKTRIYGAEVAVDWKFDECIFDGCRITRVDQNSYGISAYYRCNFSEATIQTISAIPVRKDQNNWYLPAKPPVCAGFNKWKDIFHEEMPETWDY